MEMKRVNAGSLRAIGYDESNRALRVERSTPGAGSARRLRCGASSATTSKKTIPNAASAD